MVKNHTISATAIRKRGTDLFACLGDDEDMHFGPVGARTMFFDPLVDEEAIYAHMSAAEGGHETVEEVTVTLTVAVAN